MSAARSTVKVVRIDLESGAVSPMPAGYDDDVSARWLLASHDWTAVNTIATPDGRYAIVTFTRPAEGYDYED